MKGLRRPGMSLTVAFVLTTLLAAACQGNGTGSSSPSANPTATAAQAGLSGVHVVPSDCSASSPCRLTAGTYRLGQGSVLPGLEVTLPPEWTTNEATPGELNLVPPSPQNVEVDFWLDLVAVKSSGAGHGTTILKNVGGTPDALTGWLTHNRDFLIVSKPRSHVIGHGIAMTSLTVGVSRSAKYGDPGCPSNPRCADLFTNSYWAADQNFYGIGGDEEVRLYLGTIDISGKQHTFLVALHADNHFDLVSLEKEAAKILSSVRLPAGATSS